MLKFYIFSTASTLPGLRRALVTLAATPTGRLQASFLSARRTGPIGLEVQLVGYSE